MNIKKKTVPLLLKSALKLNSIVNVYTDERIMTMTRNQLINVCYELMSYEHDTKKFKEYVIKDIKDHAYILEDQEIHFSWSEKIPDESYNLPTTIYKTITHKECYKVIDNVVHYPINITEDESKTQWVNVPFELLMAEKLDAFYDAFMEMVNKDSIFAKLKEVKEDLL